MVQVQVDLNNDEDAVVSFYKAKNSLVSKADAIKYIINLKRSDLE